MTLVLQMGKAIQEETSLQKQITDQLVTLLFRCLAHPAAAQQALNTDGVQGDALERGNAALKQGMRRLNKAYKQSKSNHLLYLALFAIALFFGVWFFSKTYRTLRWFV